MKKLVFTLFCYMIAQQLYGQKCLDINILSLSGKLQPPGSAATSFGNCATAKNSSGQTIIVNYGTAYNQLEQMIKDNLQAFTNASQAGIGTTGMPNASQVQDAQALAAKLQNMSPADRKAYVMQMAQQMQQKYSQPSATAESTPVAMLVMKTQALATTRLVPLDNEFAAKYREILGKEKDARSAVKIPVYNSCPPADKEGLPACNCVNDLDGGYWQKIIAIEDSYNQQKIALLQSYMPRIKTLVGQIEDNISKLHYGSDVKTPTYQRILFSSQSTAFGAAFDVSGSLVEDIEKSGADAYVNKVNCDGLVYNLACAHGG